MVDIIIPVHNRPRLTEQSLKSLWDHTPREIYRLHVVDDGSDEETSQLLVNTLDEMQDGGVSCFFIRHTEPLSPGYSRNEAARKALKLSNREFIYFSDNDVYFTEEWLENLIIYYEQAHKQGVRLLGGGCHAYLQNNRELNLNGMRIGIKDAVSGYSQLMLWDTWEKYGEFSESMKTAERKIMGSEDWEYCQRIRNDGFEVGSVYPELVYHCGRTNTYGDLATGAETIRNIAGVIVE